MAQALAELDAISPQWRENAPKRDLVSESVKEFVNSFKSNRDDEVRRRRRLARLLSVLEPTWKTVAISSCLAALKNASSENYYGLTGALDDLEPQWLLLPGAADALLTIVAHGDGLFRFWPVERLAKWGDPSVFKPIANLLFDKTSCCSGKDLKDMRWYFQRTRGALADADPIWMQQAHTQQCLRILFAEAMLRDWDAVRCFHVAGFRLVDALSAGASVDGAIGFLNARRIEVPDRVCIEFLDQTVDDLRQLIEEQHAALTRERLEAVIGLPDVVELRWQYTTWNQSSDMADYTWGTEERTHAISLSNTKSAARAWRADSGGAVAPSDAG
jgi:hypothetical protein